MITQQSSGTTAQQAVTFAEILTQANRWDSEFAELGSIPVRNLDIESDALIFDKSSIPMDQGARNRLFAMVKAPVSYLAERSIDTQIVALREHIRQGDFGDTLTPVTRNGELFTIASGRLIEANNVEVLTAVAESLGANADCLRLSKLERGDCRFELDLVSPARSLEIRRGDVVEAGLHIAHSRYHDEATQVHAFVYRLICENGMIRRECVSAEGIARTRRLPADHPRAKEMLLDQVRRLTAQTWAKLELQLSELRASSKRPADVHQLLRQWLQRARISVKTTDRSSGDPKRTIMDRLLEAWRAEGAEDTYYGAVNALTRVGTHDTELSRRQRRVLSLLAGVLAFSGVHLCPRCFSILGEAASAPERAAATERLLAGPDEGTITDVQAA